MPTKKTAPKKAKSPTAGNKKKIHLLHQMMRIRAMEEKAYELYTQEKIRGILHLYDGEEAVAVGVIENLQKDDSIVGTYREHGHALIRGVSMNSIMAEMYGKAEGCSGGRGGSMHLYDKATNFLGGSAIVANGLPMAVGVAFAYKRQKNNAIACCFFGEGAVDEGEFHESLNLASLWELPVLFVCENNLYSMGMPFELAEAETNLIKKAESYDIKGEIANGMDVMAVVKASEKAIGYVRKEQKPFFLECQTYRYRAHSMFDPERYRKKEEVREWKKKDPITTFTETLKTEGILSEEELKELQDKVADEVETSVQFAENGTEEPVEDLARYVYSD
ncbi:pyruvate dehydrogenase (acetyl-transferring) E1 component subunit alpha [Aliifodinibius sp. S!AR15-10]|uniref:pyruvate dehydrogenase (acetyl-transferring) E1 component subunit alpha n=1 Tax=Aliifodinibius sp. S!AR15-10 TaxID=2950437 RepID=UPI0028666EE1|nr:pyruvate dehydrogenase (acetyl-transferring) E1 component subunit alpha [Aliifodinibius sp. S!AR15-10]MDR8393943.1 pyruvate dehydrogenase (acetyl-transferring) E1 component subunit alpha [Aliifodinibius sp. S!AR15-10]